MSASQLSLVSIRKTVVCRASGGFGLGSRLEDTARLLQVEGGFPSRWAGLSNEATILTQERYCKAGRRRCVEFDS